MNDNVHKKDLLFLWILGTEYGSMLEQYSDLKLLKKKKDK